MIPIKNIPIYFKDWTHDFSNDNREGIQIYICGIKNTLEIFNCLVEKTSLYYGINRKILNPSDYVFILPGTNHLDINENVLIDEKFYQCNFISIVKKINNQTPL